MDDFDYVQADELSECNTYEEEMNAIPADWLSWSISPDSIGSFCCGVMA